MPIDAVCVYYYVGVAHFAHAHKNLRVMWHGLCALNLDVAIDIGWEASGVILDCCRRTTGVSCTKVLHLFNEAQIFDNLFVAHTIIEPLYDRRHHQHIYSSPKQLISKRLASQHTFRTIMVPAHSAKTKIMLTDLRMRKNVPHPQYSIR